MIITRGISNEPSFNLAMEEYFLKYCDDDYFILWQNRNSVIVGRNQNAYAEINSEYIRNNNIPVIRRLTGGGAVFHDMGNINYTFIKRNSKDTFNDYRFFASPIINCLRKNGIEADISGRNDILIAGKKCSGNAQCAYHNTVLHHGTLLFSTDHQKIEKALNVNKQKISSKGIKSVKSRVCNISDYLNNDWSINDFILAILNEVKENFNEIIEYTWTDEIIKRIKVIEKDKYLKDSWNYGSNMNYSVKNENYFPFGLLCVEMSIVNNTISNIRISGDFFSEKEIIELENMIIGTQYNYDKLLGRINKINIDEYIKGADIKDVISVII